jgi:hypothetical protein
MLARITLIFIAVATASTPVLARSWHHHHHHWHGWYARSYGGNYNYGGPHYAASDYYHNSRQLTGTR